MKLLLVNAKPTLADALSAHEGLAVDLVWPREHHFQNVPPPSRVQPHYYAGGGKLNLAAVWQMHRLVQQLKPDLVHAFYGRALAHVVLAATGLSRRPKIASFRGVSSPLSRFDAGDWLSFRHALVDAHACESHAVRQALIDSGIDAERCWVTYNSAHMLPARRPGRAALAQFGIPANAFVIGTIASMRRVKGIDILLRAALHCAELDNTYWLLFGHVIDPQIRELAADPRIHRHVIFPGHRLDASELISGADVFVMPSRAEALCQALLEAMMQCVCPIVSDVGGMKEVVRHAQDGLVVPVENVSALAAAIRALHADRALLAQYAHAAQQRVSESFTPEKMAARCLSMYRSFLGGAQSRAA